MAALILFPWQIACGLRIFIVERVLYVLGGDFMPLWLEFILRVASLVLFLIATIFLSYVGVRSIPTLTFVTEWNWNQVWPHLTTFIVSFPSLLCFGFAYGFGVNAAFQSNDLWNVVKRSRSLTLILTDAASVSSGAKITIAHLSDLHLTRTATRPFLKGAKFCSERNFLKVAFDLERRIDEVDLVLITGDITDSGLPKEWRNFFEGMPLKVMNKTIILPGNHDINITDKSSIWRAEF